MLGVLVLVLSGRLTPFSNDTTPPQRVASAPTPATPPQAAATPAPAPPTAAPSPQAAQTPAPPANPAPATAAESDAIAKGAPVAEQKIAPGRTADNTEQVCSRIVWGALNCTETFSAQ